MKMTNRVSEIIAQKGCLIVLIAMFGFFWGTPAQAAQPAWIFAHRANTPDALTAAQSEVDINAVEIDVTFWEDIPQEVREKGKGCDEEEEWCTYHSGDSAAFGLGIILDHIYESPSLSAVWFDVKDSDNLNVDYQSLWSLVAAHLAFGESSPRKFWGVHPYTVWDKSYPQTIFDAFPELGGNEENVFITDVNSEDEIEKVQSKCQEWQIQCGISAGYYALGSNPVKDYNEWSYLNKSIVNNSNINSTFLWTFNWSFVSTGEDELMAALYESRDYTDFDGPWPTLCGLEGNGAIVGYFNSVFDDKFCSDGACTAARQSIESGPNFFGERPSVISPEVNSYTTSNTQCD